MRHIARYIGDIFQGWIGIMSGVASIAFLTIGLIYNITGSGLFSYWVIAAFVCFAIASFNAWYKISQ
jgi:hypothetical protein